MARPPLRIGVYDKDFQRHGLVGAPKFVTVTPKFNAAGGATVGVLGTDRMIQHLIADGARMWIRDEAGQHVMSGYVNDIRGTGPARTSLMEFDIVDDFALLGEVLGWVVPTAAITAQGTAGSNWEMTGSAEAVLKAAVTANVVDRLGFPLTVEPNQNRGSTVTAKLRFHPLYDRLFPVQDGAGIAEAGIGVYVRQQPGGGLYLGVYTPQTYPRTLDERSGIIVDWSYSHSAATATRVVVGGQGEAQLRSFRYVTDTTREAAMGRKIERFRDARDVDDVSLLAPRGQETLADGAAKSGLAVALSQTANFRYGYSVRVGDRVRLALANGITIDDVLREATLSWTQDDGWKATPKIGERSGSADVTIARTIKRLATYIMNQNRT